MFLRPRQRREIYNFVYNFATTQPSPDRSRPTDPTYTSGFELLFHGLNCFRYTVLHYFCTIPCVILKLMYIRMCVFVSRVYTSRNVFIATVAILDAHCTNVHPYDHRVIWTLLRCRVFGPSQTPRAFNGPL